MPNEDIPEEFRDQAAVDFPPSFLQLSESEQEKLGTKLNQMTDMDVLRNNEEHIILCFMSGAFALLNLKTKDFVVKD